MGSGCLWPVGSSLGGALIGGNGGAKACVLAQSMGNPEFPDMKKPYLARKWGIFLFKVQAFCLKKIRWQKCGRT